MKTLVLVTFLLAALAGDPGNNPLPASETIIDLINKADKVPVYFVTNEIMYDNQVTKVTQETYQGLTGPKVSHYAVCRPVEETQTLNASYQSSKELVVSELNRVFKTDKFTIKNESEIPMGDKKGAASVMFGEIAGKHQPALKSFDFTAVSSAPIFVLCAMAGVYESDELLDNGEIPKSKRKEYEAAGVPVKPEIAVQLTNYLGVRMLYVDAKKGETKYATSEIFDASSESEPTAKLNKCPTSLSELTNQLDPGSETGNFNKKITGMFDSFAAKQWKKQK